MRRLFALVAESLLVAGVLALAWAYGAVVIAGGSMEPALRRGDVAVFRRAPKRVAVGDLTVLGGGRGAYVHRVVGKTPEGLLVTRGDANPVADFEPTSTASVKGRVVGIVPLGGLMERLVSSTGHARLWSQSQSEATTETASAKASRPQGGPLD